MGPPEPHRRLSSLLICWAPRVLRLMCCLLGLWLGAPAAAQEGNQPTTPVPPTVGTEKGGQKAPDFEMIDVLVTRTPLPGSGVNAGYRFERSAEEPTEGKSAGHTDLHQPSVSMSLAVTDWLEFAAKLPYDSFRPESEDNGKGLADLTARVLVTLWQSPDRQAAVGGGVGAAFPTGAQSKGTGGEWALNPFLAAGKVLGRVQLLADVGYTAELQKTAEGSGQQRRLLYNTAIGYSFLEEIVFPFLELNGAYTFTGASNLHHRGQLVLTPGVHFSAAGYSQLVAKRQPLGTAKLAPSAEPWWKGLSLLIGVQLPVTASRTFEWAVETVLGFDF